MQIRKCFVIFQYVFISIKKTIPLFWVYVSHTKSALFLINPMSILQQSILISYNDFDIISSIFKYVRRKSTELLSIFGIFVISLVVIGNTELSLLPSDTFSFFNSNNNNSKDQPMIRNLRLLNTVDTPSNNNDNNISHNSITYYTTSNWTGGTHPETIPDIVSDSDITRKSSSDSSKYSFAHCPQKSTEVTTTMNTLPSFLGKKGIGKPFASGYHHYSWRVNLPRVIELDVYWNYNWALYRIDDQPDNIEFIPMSWSGYNTSITLNKQITEVVIPTILDGTGPQRFLGFNEPDHPQSYMTVVDALDRWPILESLHLPLVSPSCAHPNGLWMEEFMGNATQRCYKIDYLGVHWYGKANGTRFKLDMIHLYEKFHLPIVITEFSPARFTAKRNRQNPNTPADVLLFMKDVLPWLEQQSFIVGYAWFSFLPDNPTGWSSALYDTNGTITAIGRYYKSIRNDNIYGDLSIEPDNVTSW